MAEDNRVNPEAKPDADDKMTALMDMIRDTCTKVDEGMKRMDSKIDDSMKRMDARIDSIKKDTGEIEEAGEPREPAADSRRRDAAEEREPREDARRRDADDDRERMDSRRDSEREDGRRGDARRGDDDDAEMDARRRDAEDCEDGREDTRRDADEEETRMRREDSRRKDGDEAEMDSVHMTRAEGAALRAQIARLQSRAPQIITDSERERFAAIQEQADPVFQAFGDRAPSFLDGETPTQYKRRLASKMQAHSPQWRDARLAAISDDKVLDIAVETIYADSIAAARRGSDVPSGSLRMISKQVGGHIINEFVGDTNAWMDSLAGNGMRAVGAWNLPN